MGLMIAAIPITKSVLKIFDPTILPTANSLEPFNAALILIAASGALTFIYIVYTIYIIIRN